MRRKKKRAHDFKASAARWQAAYTEYLNSPEWAAKRAYVMKRDGGLCRCGAPAEQVHHLTYRRVRPPNFSERMSDLVAICIPCHRRAHGTS